MRAISAVAENQVRRLRAHGGNSLRCDDGFSVFWYFTGILFYFSSENPQGQAPPPPRLLCPCNEYL